MTLTNKDTDNFPVPVNEQERLEDILAYDLDNTIGATGLDQVCTLARNLFGAPIACVCLIGRDQLTMLATSGTDITHIPRKDVFSNHTILGDEVFVIPDTLKDRVFAQNPFVTGPLAIRFYAAVPLHIHDGVQIGALCILDQTPRELSGNERVRLKALGEIANKELQRRQALVELKRQKQLWAHTAQMVKIGSWSYLPKTGFMEVCPYSYDIFEVDTGTKPTSTHILNHLRQHMDSALESALDRLVRAGDRLDHVTEFMTEAGRKRWFHFFGHAEWQNGEIVRVSGGVQDVTETRERDAEIRRLAYTDALTDLPNRAYFQHYLKEISAQSSSAARDLGLVLIDVDHLKEINHTFGVEAGDAVLCTFASRLKDQFGEGFGLSRYAGDEFALVLARGEGDWTIDASLERLKRIMNEAVKYRGQTLPVTVSVGIALPDCTTADLDQLLGNAALALDLAKKSGRNRSVQYEPGMRLRQIRSKQLLNDIRKGLARGEFEPHFQPIIDIRTNRISGFEALMRWHHPERGVLPPSIFEAGFEDPELSLLLGEAGIEGALRHMRSWQDSGIDFGSVAVNLSSFQLQSGRLAAEIEEKLRCWNLSADRLALEVTENVYIGWDASNVTDTIQALHALGVNISVDDFGTGYASLMSLNKFPIDRLKIDKSFVQDRNGGAVLQAIMILGSRLGMKVIAEGVEDENQLAAVYAMGCDQVQGYYYSKPMSAENVPTYIKAFNRKDTDCLNTSRVA